MKSFCQELQGDETPWSKSQNWKQKQYFVSLTHCINFSNYFNDDSSDWRLYFKGVGYNGRIKDLEGYYFIDGLMFKDKYKNIEDLLHKYNFRTQLRAYKNFDSIGQKHKKYKKYTGLYEGNYYIDGLQADNYDLFSGFDEDGLQLNDYFALSDNKLYKNGSVFTGKSPYKIGINKGNYIDGINFKYDGESEIVNGKTYRFKVNKNIFGDILEPQLGYQYSPTYVATLSGFNPTTLGNGKNSYYAQGYPTTKLCKNSSNCSDDGASINDIYKKFKNVNLDDIFAWIGVATEYSHLNYKGAPPYTAAPILFKGHNPHTGEFGGKNYRLGYQE